MDCLGLPSNPDRRVTAAVTCPFPSSVRQPLARQERLPVSADALHHAGGLSRHGRLLRGGGGAQPARRQNAACRTVLVACSGMARKFATPAADVSLLQARRDGCPTAPVQSAWRLRLCDASEARSRVSIRGEVIHSLILTAASLSRARRSSVSCASPGGSLSAESRAFLAASSSRSSNVCSCLTRFRLMVGFSFMRTTILVDVHC
jgi:hypothetical protein